MEDSRIVDMYWQRLETAIDETALKYGKMLQHLSESILYSHEDAEECVNDSYLAAWNSMPQNRPTYLGGYMAKITRNKSLNRAQQKKAAKRSGELTVYDELSECIPDSETTVAWLENRGLKEILDSFLASLETGQRVIFMRRYFYSDSMADIATALGISEGNVRTTLFRIRKKLRRILEEKERF